MTMTQTKWDALPPDVRKTFVDTDIELPDAVWDRALDGAVSMSILVNNMLEVRAHYATTQRAELIDIRTESLVMLDRLTAILCGVSQALAEIDGEHPGYLAAKALYDEVLEHNWLTQRENQRTIDRVDAAFVNLDLLIVNVDAVLARWATSTPRAAAMAEPRWPAQEAHHQMTTTKKGKS